MIIILGIAGSGKTTQGKLVAHDLGCAWLSTGQLLRQSMSGGFAEQMNRGELLDDNLLLPMLDDKLAELGADKNEMVLDGSPRTMDQAKWLVDKITAGQVKLTAIIHLKVSREVVKQRLLQRGRSDDTEASIAQRFKDYEQNILPILSYLSGQGFKINEVDGTAEPQAIASQIEKIVREA